MENKKRVKDIIKLNPYFFIPYFLFLILGAVVLLLNRKGDVVIWLNGNHNTFFDTYFFYASLVGKGVLFGYFILLLGAFKFRFLLLGLATFLGSGAVTQILKHMFKENRPKGYFDSLQDFHLLEGVKLYSSLSFPSGHTTAGFSIFIFLSLITKYKPLGLLFFLLALSVGLSRAYLVQHFFIDIYFGSLIGTFISVLIYLLFENHIKIKTSKWYNYSLTENLFFKKANKNLNI